MDKSANILASLAALPELPDRVPDPSAPPPAPPQIFGGLSALAKRKDTGQPSLRDNLRQKANSIIGSRVGNALSRWYGSATGKGQA